jgi:hypothetical protein
MQWMCTREEHQKPFSEERPQSRRSSRTHSFRCVSGPMPSSFNSRYLYYVSFINDYYHKTWLYLLKSKYEVFKKFKEFKSLIENLSKRNIKILMSDNGGEYTSKEFVNFCKDVGIKRELTTPYNPQQNGVVERKNRTIVEVVKTMIHDQDLPMCLWEEA